MEADLLVVGGKVVLDNGLNNVSVAIKDGKIVAIGQESHMPSAVQIVDANGNIVLPGIIDDHVHAFQYEDAKSCSKAAAAGGVTTMMDHPILPDTTTTVSQFEEKRRMCERDSLIDFCLLGGITPGKIDGIAELVRAGAVGFKAGMFDIVKPIYQRMNDGELLEALRNASAVDSLVGVHAENDEIISYLTAKNQQIGRKDPSVHEESRPVISELEATSRAILLAEAANCRLHIFHCSIPSGVEAVDQAKKRGLRTTVEVCPHYLVLDKKRVEGMWAYGKIAPPIRSAAEVALLWDKVAEGKCDIISSDHAPWPKETKDKGNGDIWAAPGGAPGVQDMLPLMLSEGVNKGRISLFQLVKMMCTNPAKVWRIYPQKGTTRIGSDGDLTIVDLDKEWTIRGQNEYTQVGWTPYEGWIVKGVVTHTIVRGNLVAREGEMMGSAGYGKFISYQKEN